jgi:hypothetical protein
MNVSRKTLIISLLLSFAIGSAIGGGESSPDKKPERPGVKWLGRVARLGLWFLALGEPAPQPQQHVGAVEGGIDHYRSL